MLFSWQYFEATLSIHYKTLQETCWWNLQKIHRLGSILQTPACFTLGSQNGRRGEERPPTIFFKWEQWPPMDDVMQSGKGLTQHHAPPPHVCGAMTLKCSRGQCCITARLSTVRENRRAVAAKITSVSVTPLIPFNPSELMSSFASRQPPQAKGCENRGRGLSRSH